MTKRKTVIGGSDSSHCSSVIAALFVDPDGVYAELDNVEIWDEARDARNYRGPHRVIAHPPCQRWGRFWHGSTAKPHQYRPGEDGGCFACALTAVRNYGGVLEHPASSLAWRMFGIVQPLTFQGWSEKDSFGGRSCYVEQAHYGHMARKPTWLYAVDVDFKELNWSKSEQRLHPVALERHGYEKARRIGMMAMVGGKDKTKIRNATPREFRDVLVSMIR